MKKMFLAILLFASCSGAGEKDNKAASTANAKSSSYSISFTEICSGLKGPVGLVNAHDSTQRLFIIEQGGQIRIVKNGRLLAQPFLDITPKLDKMGEFYSEKGLLGLAFHPKFKTNGKFYVYYSAPPTTKGMDNTSVIAEYTVSSNPDIAGTNEKIILQIDEPEANHNGGQLAFGKDGYLYIGVGDGGGAGDKHGETGNGQNLNTLLGKILRIDVNASSAYSIPADNPFVNKGKGEIWAYGLRNPWRFSFDTETGQLFCGDVGQDTYEEVDNIEKGKNYGWRIMEGKHCYNPATDCNTAGLELPVDEYSHDIGKCIIGGYVYRGTKYPDMAGKYIFGDWTGKFFMLLKPSETGTWERRDLSISTGEEKLSINSFGQDEIDELYVCVQSSIGPRKDGKVYRIEFN